MKRDKIILITVQIEGLGITYLKKLQHVDIQLLGLLEAKDGANTIATFEKF